MKTKKLALGAMILGVALVLSYLESLVPPVGIPGVKLGLGNIVILGALYLAGPKEAAAISFMRVVLSSLLFGSLTSFVYSLAGAALSLAVMILLMRPKIFSKAGVSVGGGVSHNAGQLAAAALMLRSGYAFSYFPVLLISGTLSGALIGIAASTVIERISKKQT